MKLPIDETSDVLHPFIHRHSADVIGTIHGWDRLRFQGTLRSLYYPSVIEYYLRKVGVLWKDFREFATGITDRVRQAATTLANEHGQEVIYLPSSRTSKEEMALDLRKRHRIDSGLVAVFSCVELARTWRACGNYDTKKLEMHLRWGKCIHLYFYLIHQQLGWLSVRVQTWFPFLVQVCINGREWLARQMDEARVAYRREDNCFTWVSDPQRAQGLMNQQHRANWVELMSQLVDFCHPMHAEITRPIERDYYWTAAESEYAWDVMFRDRAALQRIYPSLVHHAVMSFGSEQVLRFLTRSKSIRSADDIKTDRRRGEDGVRVKHWLNKNSVKAYDKGSVLRAEVTINEPKDFKVWRTPENKPDGQMQWRILRRSVADMNRRAEVSQRGAERYLTALSAVHISESLGQEAASLCKPAHKKGQRHRALNPFAEADAQLLAAVNRGEFALNGFRNRDIRALICAPTDDSQQLRAQAASVGRRLRLLRGHGLIQKIPKTHRYIVTQRGQRTITALITARNASTEKLTALAA